MWIRFLILKFFRNKGLNCLGRMRDGFSLKYICEYRMVERYYVDWN